MDPELLAATEGTEGPTVGPANGGCGAPPLPPAAAADVGDDEISRVLDPYGVAALPPTTGPAKAGLLARRGVVGAEFDIDECRCGW